MDSSPDSPKQCQAQGGLDSCIAKRRRILYFCPAERGGEDFIEVLQHCDRCSLGPGCAHPRVTCYGEEVCWVSEQTVEGALSRLGEYYISLVLIDVRWREGCDLEAWIEQVVRLLEQMDATTLIDIARRMGQRPVPEEQWVDDVTILDVYENVASVRVDAAQWIDYLHLARWNGDWKIVNVLWEMHPSG